MALELPDGREMVVRAFCYTSLASAPCRDLWAFLDPEEARPIFEEKCMYVRDARWEAP